MLESYAKLYIMMVNIMSSSNYNISIFIVVTDPVPKYVHSSNQTTTEFTPPLPAFHNQSVCTDSYFFGQINHIY